MEGRTIGLTVVVAARALPHLLPFHTATYTIHRAFPSHTFCTHTHRLAHAAFHARAAARLAAHLPCNHHLPSPLSLTHCCAARLRILVRACRHAIATCFWPYLPASPHATTTTPHHYPPRYRACPPPLHACAALPLLSKTFRRIHAGALLISTVAVDGMGGRRAIRVCVYRWRKKADSGD